MDWLSLGVLVTAPIVANLILGALSRQREYQTDREAVALTGDPAGLARAIELIEMAQKRIASGAFPGAVRIRLPRLLLSHPDPKDRIPPASPIGGRGGAAGSGRAHRYPGLFPRRAEAAVGAFGQNSGPVAPDWIDRSIGGRQLSRAGIMRRPGIFIGDQAHRLCHMETSDNRGWRVIERQCREPGSG